MIDLLGHELDIGQNAFIDEEVRINVKFCFFPTENSIILSSISNVLRQYSTCESTKDRKELRNNQENYVVRFIYSEKATKFSEIFTLPLSYVVPVKSNVKMSQNFVASSEYMNFKSQIVYLFHVAVGVHVVPVAGVDGVAGCVGWGVGGGGGVRARCPPGLIGDGVQLSFQG